jgi:ATP:ADP antiporter, AAA family
MPSSLKKDRLAGGAWQPGSPLVAALLGSAAGGGQYVAGRAARDAIFLTNFEASSLPAMISVTAIFSIALVLATSKALKQVSPARWVPVAFGGMSVLVLADWALAASAPKPAAWMLFLLVSGIGPMLGSGFWLIVSERFDPHTAKKVFGHIAGAGTLGGMLAGLAAAWIAANGGAGAMLPLLAGLNLAGAWLIRRLAKSSGAPRHADDGPAPAPSTQSVLRTLTDARHLRNLAALVMLLTIAATFVDQAFKTRVQTTLAESPSLGSFFSLYYAAIGVITFVIQAGGSRFVLEKLGLAVAAATPALTVLVGGAGALLMPGLNGLILLRAGEAICRASIYRGGYELFYTPMPRHDKRAVKTIIDVGVDRTGDIVGASITQQLLWIPQPRQTTVLIGLAMACAGIAVLLARRLTRAYVYVLEKSLLSRAVEIELSEVEDLTTRTTVSRALRTSQIGRSENASRPKERSPTPDLGDPEVERILALHSGDREAVRRVLRSANGPSAALVPHVIPLLAWDDVSQDCIRALRSVAEERVGELADALLDPNQPFAVRRRLARVFSVCTSQRAADGVLLGLDDLRFEVRYQAGRSLLAIVEKNPAIRIDKTHVFGLVDKEVAVNRHVWENRRLLDASEDGDDRSFLEELVRTRASQSLAHVFTLLALVLPAEPLRIAFRGLHTDDQALRGTALEYLDSVLPPEIRDRLWHFLDDRPVFGTVRRPCEDTLADLLRSHDSIRLNLEELKRRGDPPHA